MVVVIVVVVVVHPVDGKLSTFFGFACRRRRRRRRSFHFRVYFGTVVLCIQTKLRDSLQNTAAAADSASDAQLNGPTPMDTSSPAPLTTTTTSTAAATPTQQTATASPAASVSITPTPTATARASTPSAGQPPAVASSDEPAGAVSTTTTAPQTSTTTSASFSTTTSSSLSASTTTSIANAASAAASTPVTSVAPVTTATSAAAPTPVTAVSANGLLSATTATSTPPTNTATSVTGTTPTNPQPPTTTPTAANTGTGGGGNTGLPPQSKTGTTDKGGLPKAMIKPNVLTHVIEGFVILEANEPFPNHWQRGPEWDSSDEPPKKRAITDSASPISPSNGQPQQQVPSSQPTHPGQPGVEMGNCEICGKPEPRSKMKRKRFCSVDCARAAKQNSTDQVTSPSHNGTATGHEAHPTSTGNNGLDHSSVTTTVNPVAPSNIKLERMDSMDQSASHHPAQFAAATPMETGTATIPVVPAAVTPEETPVIVKWSVQEVCDFIKNLPGCSDYAEDFAIHEIDGQALLLLKENHLVNTMGMKLGPALKIVAKIHSMIVNVNADGQQQQS